MTDLIKLRAIRPMWHAGQAVKAGEAFKADVADAQAAVCSGRAEPADEVELATFTVGMAKERQKVARLA